MNLTLSALKKLQQDGVFADPGQAKTPSEPRVSNDNCSSDGTEKDAPASADDQPLPEKTAIESRDSSPAESPDLEEAVIQLPQASHETVQADAWPLEQPLAASLSDVDTAYDMDYSPIIPSMDDLLDDDYDVQIDGAPGRQDLLPVDDREQSDRNDEPISRPAYASHDAPSDSSSLPNADSLANEFAFSREDPRVSKSSVGSEHDSAHNQPSQTDSQAAKAADPRDTAHTDGEASPYPRLGQAHVDPAGMEFADAEAVGQADFFDERIIELMSIRDSRDAVRQLTESLKAQCGDSIPQVLLMTSVTATRRSADVLGVMAAEFGQRGERVLLVDADLSNQVMTRAYMALGAQGLCDVLGDLSDASATIRPTQTKGVCFVPCGDDVLGISREPALLSESRLVQTLRTWEEDFDRILIDGGCRDSALLPCLGRNCQATILLVPHPKVEAALIRHAAKELTNRSAHVIGCVLTDYPATPT